MKRLKEYWWVFVVGLVILGAIFLVSWSWKSVENQFKSESQGVSVSFSDQVHTSVVALSFKEMGEFLSSGQAASLAIGISPEKEGMRILYIATGLDGKPRFATKTVAGGYVRRPRIEESEKEIRIVGGNWNDVDRFVVFVLDLFQRTVLLFFVAFVTCGAIASIYNVLKERSSKRATKKS